LFFLNSQTFGKKQQLLTIVIINKRDNYAKGEERKEVEK